MPAQKRSATENRDGVDWAHHNRAKQSRRDPEFEEAEPKEDPNDRRRRNQEDDGEEAGAEEGSEGSPSSSSGDGDKPTDYPQFISLQLPEIRTDVMCPICLGIIKKTRTVMECLHRFCRECIDKSMRLGNNECPACRTHCASRRSLRDDPNYDALISALYPDIDKYEEQELAFHEEERKRNKQIQEAIAQISERQTEALAKRRALGKDTAGEFTTRSQRSHQNAHLRRRRNTRNIVLQGSEDDEDENDNNEGQDSSSTDEQSTEIRQQQYRRRAGAQASQPSSSTSNSDGRCLENDLEGSRRIFPRPVWTAEMLTWGRGGTRSNIRHSGSNNKGGTRSNSRHSGSNNKKSQINRVSKLANYFSSLEQINYELDDVYVMLVSLDTKSAPSLQQPHLCCQPSYSVEHLYEYIACQTPLEPEDVEIVLMKEQDYTNEPIPLMGNPRQNELHILEGRETLGGLKARITSYTDCLILGYRRKETA